MLERLQKGWQAPIYAFYRPDVAIGHKGDRRYHVFTCAGPACNHPVRRYLDGPDATSTGNLRNHVRNCKAWGPDVLTAADNMKTKQQTLGSLQKLTGGMTQTSIALAFERKGKGKISYLTRMLTTNETRSVIGA